MAVMVKFWGAHYVLAQKVMQQGILEILKLACSIFVCGACSKQPVVQSGDRQVPKADAFFQQPFVQLGIVIPKRGQSERQFETIGQLPGAATMPALVQSFGAGFEAFVRDNRNTSGGRLNLVITVTIVSCHRRAPCNSWHLEDEFCQRKGVWLSSTGSSTWVKHPVQARAPKGRSTSRF
ncbi:hypothetical protein B0F90DRAFT_1857517 [Multifurca ochricompacta]|uniref:Uncharacterized protein n=1 Tax=Multifurca ochricompacta TaxID=376703 RepID=A0AAD4M2C8_9AGAM|nr:hypothetical protein B0F90DRAFT_1857517 [Multifurca ochricompacta]